MQDLHGDVAVNLVPAEEDGALLTDAEPAVISNEPSLSGSPGCKGSASGI